MSVLIDDKIETKEFRITMRGPNDPEVYVTLPPSVDLSADIGKTFKVTVGGVSYAMALMYLDSWGKAEFRRVLSLDGTLDGTTETVF